MKKGMIVLVLVGLVWGIQAQEKKSYKQQLRNCINVVEASGEVIVRVVDDTTNYVMIKVMDLPGGVIGEKEMRQVTGAVVKVDSNRLATTPHAYGKVITIGTTEQDSLTFITKNGAEIMYQDRCYRNDGCVVYYKNQASGPKRNWTGLTKYGFGARLQWDFLFGFSSVGNGILGLGGGGNDLFKMGKFASGCRWTIGYSLYMDDHIGLGVGVDLINTDQYTLNTHYVENGATGEADLRAPSIANSDRWSSNIVNMSIGLPLHFVYFPNKNRTFNIEVDLVPKLCYMSKYSLNYQYEDESGPVNVSEMRNLTHTTVGMRRFGLDLRVGAEIGIIGIYAETGLLPMGDFGLDNTLQDKYGIDRMEAFHFSFGLKIGLFNLGRDK